MQNHNNAQPSPTRPQRLASLDWMRGFVMILMIIDHASMAFNGSRLAVDSAGMYEIGTALPLGQFLTRWISHICAPTFVFLAGTALALSVDRRLARGKSSWSIDRDILIRGLFIALLDPTLISLGSGRFTFQVLYAIGVAMMMLVPLRRLPGWLLLTIGLSWMACGELITALFWNPAIGLRSVVAALTVGIYFQPDLKIVYPLFPWLAIMVLGWVFGQYLARYRSGAKVLLSPVRLLCGTGLILLGLFALVRGTNDYGNMFLLRQDGSLVQWLFVSKYPPSLSFMSLELGLMLLCLALFMVVENIVAVRKNGPLLVFGQTALFFYLVHRLVLEGIAYWLDYRGFGNLEETYIISTVMLLVLYPLCLWYRKVKQSHPQSLLRFI
jgi:uncharacterized membrane protein